MHDSSEIDRNKLNPEFAARLNQFAPDQKIRVIVLLQVEETGSLNRNRQSRMECNAAIHRSSSRFSGSWSLSRCRVQIRSTSGSCLLAASIGLRNTETQLAIISAPIVKPILDLSSKTY
jgi:hypothetical protein